MGDLSPLESWIASRLVDAAWYAAFYGDVGEADAWAHFRATGAAAGRDPNPLFSTGWYLARYPQVAASGLTALEHYVARGAALGYDPGPLFSTRWYLGRNPDVAAAGQNPLDHYLEWGPAQRRDPSPVFDSAWYFSHYPEALADGVDARVHYMRRGARLGHAPCALFDTRWYLAQYRDVVASGINPLLHYLTVGAALGRDPGPEFSTKRYLARHPELRAVGENPLVHFLMAERLPAGPPPQALVNRVSAAAIREAAALVSALGPLEDLPVAAGQPPLWEAAWRALYLSLTALPRGLVLVGRIDAEAEGLAALVAEPEGTLVVETDGAEVSVGDGLPVTVAWRSLSEFAPGLDPAGRAAVTAVLVAALRPERVVVRGSTAAAAMLAGHGARLGAAAGASG